MKNLPNATAIVWAVMGWTVTQSWAQEEPGERFPADGGRLIQKVLDRAQTMAARPDLEEYRFFQTTEARVMNRRGKVEETRETTYDVHYRTGERRVTTLLVDGRPADERELQRENEKERNRYLESRTAPERDSNIWLTDKVVSRYHFTVVGGVELDGRPAHILDFRPRSADLPEEGRLDEVLNRVAGRLWIDAADHEIARAEVRLQEKARVRGGFVSSLDSLSFSLTRKRTPDGIWFNGQSNLEVEGRKLFGRTRLEIASETGGFRAGTLVEETGALDFAGAEPTPGR